MAEMVSAFFSAIYPHEEVVLEVNENYLKHSYRNRCRINTANGPVSLSIPVVGGNSKTPIRDLKIDYNQTWVKDHWRAIQSAYGYLVVLWSVSGQEIVIRIGRSVKNRLEIDRN